MLCSKCHEEIEERKEIQVEGSIICQECAKKPIAYCFTCFPEKSLYNNDTIHEISVNRGNDLNIWILLLSAKRSRSEKVFQCDICYQEWKKDKEEEEKKWWNKKKIKKVIEWLPPISLFVSLGLAFYLFYPKKFERLKEKWKITIIFFLCLLIFLVFLVKAIFKEDNRYKIRKRNRR